MAKAADASASSSALKPSSANGSGKPAVRMVSFFDECDHEFDLTSHCSHGGSIRMICEQQCLQRCFDVCRENQLSILPPCLL